MTSIVKFIKHLQVKMNHFIPFHISVYSCQYFYQICQLYFYEGNVNGTIMGMFIVMQI